jgi:hypothetical protein
VPVSLPGVANSSEAAKPLRQERSTTLYPLQGMVPPKAK